MLYLCHVINLVLIFPVCQILKSDGDVEYSRPSIFDKTESAYTFSMMFYSEDAGVRRLLGTSSIAGALFGAAHCLAWNLDFPSRAEQIIWKIAALG